MIEPLEDMSFNVIGATKKIFDGEIVAKLGDFLNETPENISDGLCAAVPIIMGGLVSFAKKRTNGPVMLKNMIEETAANGNNRSLLRQDLLHNSSSRLPNGYNILNNLFQGKLTGVTEMIASTTKTNKLSVLALMSLIVVPMLLELDGQIDEKDGVDGEFVNLILDQELHIRNEIPEEMKGLVALLF